MAEGHLSLDTELSAKRLTDRLLSSCSICLFQFFESSVIPEFSELYVVLYKAADAARGDHRLLSRYGTVNADFKYVPSVHVVCLSATANF